MTSIKGIAPSKNWIWNLKMDLIVHYISTLHVELIFRKKSISLLKDLSTQVSNILAKMKWLGFKGRKVHEVDYLHMILSKISSHALILIFFAIWESFTRILGEEENYLINNKYINK